MSEQKPRTKRAAPSTPQPNAGKTSDTKPAREVREITHSLHTEAFAALLQAAAKTRRDA